MSENQTLDQAIELMESKKKKLIPVADPTKINSASVDIDKEMHKLAWNMKVLVDLKKLSSDQFVKLDHDYKKKSYDLAESLTDEELKKICVVKSNKFKYIDLKLHEEIALKESMKNKYKYFFDMWETYRDWSNIYKKTRQMPDQYH